MARTYGGGVGGGLNQVVAKTADYTVTAADNGTLFTTQGAGGAVNFTLPTLAAGLRYAFFNEADQNMTITAAAVDTMVGFNNLVANAIAFTTTSEKAGAYVEVVANADATKWLTIVHLGLETQSPTLTA